MRKAFPIILLILMSGIGVLLVYQEAQAIIPACAEAEWRCTVVCWGTFSLENCWQYQGITYCYFLCKDFHLPGQCAPWQDPYEGECEGDL